MLLSSSLSTPENTTASVGDKFLPLPLLDYKKILDGFLQMHTACKAIKRAASYISSKASDVLDGRLLPLVVTNLHHHPEWTSSRCPNIFGPSFLNDNYGDKGYTVSSYFEYLNKPAAQRSPRHLYGKDLSCPEEWKAAILSKIMPEDLKMKGPNDLLGFLPVEMQPECLMAYIGGDGTLTPCHVDLCGSVGHNILVHQSTEDSRAEWTIVPPSYKKEASEYWSEKTGHPNALELDGWFLEKEDLASAPFPIYCHEQRLGDLIVIPPDSPHQVLNRGGFNMKIAWNRITPQSLYNYHCSIQHSYKKLCKREVYRTKAICYHSVLGLVSSLEGLFLYKESADKGVQTKISKLEVLLKMFKEILKDEWIGSVDPYPPSRPLSIGADSSPIQLALKDKYREENYKIVEKMTNDPASPLSSKQVRLYIQMIDIGEELAHTRICDFCQEDIWNRCFHCSMCCSSSASLLPGLPFASSSHASAPNYSNRGVAKLDGVDICFECYARGRCCSHSIMTLIQTFESHSQPLSFYERATKIIDKWRQKESAAFLPRGSHNIREELSTQSTCPTVGTLAFNLNLERAVRTLANENRIICSVCTKSSQSLSSFVIPCKNNKKTIYSDKCGTNKADLCISRETGTEADGRSGAVFRADNCDSSICHACAWDIYGTDPFEIFICGLYECGRCSRDEPTPCRSVLLEKKASALMPWIGCVFPMSECLVSSFFDRIVDSAFEKLCEPTTANAFCGSSPRRILHMILSPDGGMARKSLQAPFEPFEKMLPKCIDVGLGLAVKRRLLHPQKKTTESMSLSRPAPDTLCPDRASHVDKNCIVDIEVGGKKSTRGRKRCADIENKGKIDAGDRQCAGCTSLTVDDGFSAECKNSSCPARDVHFGGQKGGEPVRAKISRSATDILLKNSDAVKTRGAPDGATRCSISEPPIHCG